MFLCSFLYGNIIGIIYHKLKKYLYIYKKYLNYLNSTLMISIFSIVYFIITLKICFGKTNLYYIIVMLFGFYISEKYFTRNM